MSLRHKLITILRLGLKEFASLLADKVLLFFIVYSFTFSVYEVATGVSSGVNNATIAIVDADHSRLSGRIAQAFLPPTFQPAVLLDRAEVNAAQDAGRFTFVLEIPPDFEADLIAGRNPALQLNIDATAMTQGGLGAGYVQTIVARETAASLTPVQARPPPINLITRAWFNPNLDDMWFQAVLAVIDNITIISILLVGAAVIREREHGTIEHLLVMPVTAAEIATAKIWANGAVILLAAGLSLLVMVRGLLAVPIPGSIPLFLVGTALYLFATTSLGMLLATVTRSMPQFALMAIPVHLVLTMLSGAYSPLENMPDVLESVMQASPTVHFVSLAQAILYRGAGVETVWPQMSLLLGLGAVFMALALSQFRAMLARS